MGTLFAHHLGDQRVARHRQRPRYCIAAAVVEMMPLHRCAIGAPAEGRGKHRVWTTRAGWCPMNITNWARGGSATTAAPAETGAIPPRSAMPRHHAAEPLVQALIAADTETSCNRLDSQWPRVITRGPAIPADVR